MDELVVDALPDGWHAAEHHRRLHGLRHLAVPRLEAV